MELLAPQTQRLLLKEKAWALPHQSNHPTARYTEI
jgi:hypothetical protein